MANDYIRREDAIKAVHEEFDDCVVWDESGERTADEVESIIDRVLSADVAPVVRCENCIHWSDSNQCARPELSGSRWHDPKYFDTYPDDFCSYGERKE